MVVFSHSIAVSGMLGGILTLHIAAGTTNTNGLEIPTESEETTIFDPLSKTPQHHVAHKHHG